MPEKRAGADDRDNSVLRVELFSDAVFAIAMTLLVVELHPPTLNDLGQDPMKLGHWLYEHARTYVAFFISFFIIALQWVDHHGMFIFIKRCDRGLVWRNLLFLLCIAFLPFPTALMGQYPLLRVTLMLYSAVIAISIAAKLLLWTYPMGKVDLVVLEFPRDYFRRMIRVELCALAGVLVLMLIAVRYQKAAADLWALLGAGLVIVKVRDTPGPTAEKSGVTDGNENA